MTDHMLSSLDDVQAVLRSPDFAPPRAAPEPADSVSTLRSEMARFSHASDHKLRRGHVDAAIANLDIAQIAHDSMDRTSQILNGDPLDAVTSIAYVVPTEALAHTLGVAEADLDAARADVRSVVEVIGRGEPTSPEANNAVDRLRDRLEHQPAGSVAAISLLYQNHDATAALLACTLDAWSTDGPRRSALSRTVRTAERATKAGALFVAAGDSVVLDLEATGLEFGSGPHQCPGRATAEAIVEGIMSAIRASGYLVDVDRVERGTDGRPTSIPINQG